MQRSGAKLSQTANDLRDGARIIAGLLALIAVGIWILVFK